MKMVIKRQNDDILANPIKKQKLQDLYNIIQSDAKFKPADINPNMLNSFQFNNPSLHNIPKDVLPIVQKPYEMNDFFTDLNYSNIKIKKLNEKAGKILNIFPPPLPPPIPNTPNDGSGKPKNGIMIPFIYPTPPIIRLSSNDDGDVAPENVKVEKKPLQPEKKVAKRGRPRKEPRPDLDKENKNNEKRNDETYDRQNDVETSDDSEDNEGIDDMIELAPLPFPPKNYMPFPLNAQLSTLTPHDVFTDFLEAVELVPRIDMVVASAAGTLNDLKQQSIQEKFSTSEYDRLQTIYEDSYDNEIDRSNYYENIILTNKVDKYNTGPIVDLGTQPSYPKIDAIVSDVYYEPDTLMRRKIKSAINEKEIMGIEVDESGPGPKLHDIITPSMSNREFNSSTRESRRLEVLKSVSKLEHYSEDHKEDIFQMKKNELLTKINNLRQSTISFNGNDIKDEELFDFNQELEIDKDLELMKLRIWTNYEYLKLSSNFYNDSNKNYKKFNGSTLNKLLKLKNYIQFQKDHFEKILKSEKALNDLTDLSNRDVTKIFSGTAERDYNKDLKTILKNSLNNIDNSKLIELLKYNEFNSSPSTTPEPTTNKNETTPATESNSKNKKFSTPSYVEDITDFSTLTSFQEFDLIIGNNVKFKKDNKFNNIKHQIFKNPLYETSGSDTNSYSTSGIGIGGESSDTGVKRRGRRSLEVNEDNLHSESYLLAKISKHFVGPQPIDSEELAQDFNAIGIESNWK